MYKIEYSREADKFLNKIPKKEAEKIKEEIDSLAENPRKQGVIKLSGKNPAQYRTRQGDYRVIFSIHDNVMEILIIKVSGRENAY